jgi:dihydrofolate reductase
MSIWARAVRVDGEAPGRYRRSTTSGKERSMPRVVVFNHLTLDGVMQAPGRPDEDRRDGFRHGGWAAADNDPVMAEMIAEGVTGGGSLLFGRWTYESMYAFWPNQTDNPFTPVLDSSQKYVASTTLREPLPWRNSTLLRGDAAEAVARLKEQPGKDMVILGSGVLVQSLMRRNLIDEYQLLIHPVVLGSGRRLFTDGVFAALRLVDSVTTTTGVVIARYQPAEAPAGGRNSG